MRKCEYRVNEAHKHVHSLFVIYLVFFFLFIPLNSNGWCFNPVFYDSFQILKLMFFFSWIHFGAGIFHLENFVNVNFHEWNFSRHRPTLADVLHKILFNMNYLSNRIDGAKSAFSVQQNNSLKAVKDIDMVSFISCTFLEKNLLYQFLWILKWKWNNTKNWWLIRKPRLIALNSQFTIDVETFG